MDTHQDELHDHDKGLSHDLPRLLTRRRSLALLGGAGLAAFTAACSTGDDGTATDTSGSGQGGQGGSTTVGMSEIPEETGGPYPADGSNGVNVLVESGVVRSDITPSFGSASGVAEGVPLSIELTVVDVSEGAVPLTAPPSTSGTAPGTASTRCTRRASPTRTTCAACRKWTPKAG